MLLIDSIAQMTPALHQRALNTNGGAAAESSLIQADCIVQEVAWARVDIVIRFPQMAGAVAGDRKEGAADRMTQEPEIALGEFSLEGLCEEGVVEEIEFAGRNWADPATEYSGTTPRTSSRQETRRALIEITAREVGEHLYVLHVCVSTDGGNSCDQAGLMPARVSLECFGGTLVAMSDLTDEAVRAMVNLARASEMN